MTKTQNRFGISNFGHCDLEFLILLYPKIARYLYRQSYLALSWPEGRLAGTVMASGRCLPSGPIVLQSLRDPRTNK